MRLLVCGGRDYKDLGRVTKILDRVHRERGITVVIHGGVWAGRNGVPIHEYPAQWEEHGRAAGAIRNQFRLEDEKPDGVIAFPGGGTAAI